MVREQQPDGVGESGAHGVTKFRQDGLGYEEHGSAVSQGPERESEAGVIVGNPSELGADFFLHGLDSRTSLGRGFLPGPRLVKEVVAVFVENLVLVGMR